MTVEHTPGPVHVWQHGDPKKMIPIVPDSHPTTVLAYVGVAGWPNEANAARLAAAWNACEGIPTEALEAGVVKELVDALTDIRATLLKKADSRYNATLGDLVSMLDKADAVLAKAKGENTPPVEGR